MYALTTFIWVNNKPNWPDFRIRKYITVQRGLTWQQAKDARRNDRSLQIVRQ